MLLVALMSFARITSFYHFYHSLICPLNYGVFSVSAAAL